MKPEWIVVANAALARLFSRDATGGPLTALQVLQHPDSRAPVHTLVHDRAGHENTDHHSGGARYAPRTEPRERSAADFAVEVTHRLDEALRLGECGTLVLVAAPAFLGELRQHLSPAATRALRGSLSLDLTHLGLDDLEQRLAHVHPEFKGI